MACRIVDSENEREGEADDECAESPEKAIPLERVASRTKPRQWLYDRCNGKSKYGRTRPPIPIFYVPFPVKIWPDILEQNCLCERLGNIGAVDPENTRVRLWGLRLGLTANIASFFLTLYTCIAISNSFHIIRASSLSAAVITDAKDLLPDVFVDIGLRAVALENVLTVGEETVPFADFCGLVGKGLFRYMDPERCNDCEDISFALIITLCLSLLGYLPTLATDVLRMYSNYDVNCQKVFASFFSLFSLAMAVRTWKQYESHCFYGFYKGDTTFTINGTDEILGLSGDVVNGNETDIVINFDWQKGPGLISLQVGALLKAVDIVVNLIIPTPTITRDHDEQARYEEVGWDRPTTGPGVVEEASSLWGPSDHL